VKPTKQNAPPAVNQSRGDSQIEETHCTTDGEAVQRYAELPPFEYDRTRKDLAKEKGVSVGALDDVVKAARKDSTSDGSKGRELVFYEPEPWSDPVDGAEVLTEAADHIVRHMVIDKGDANACAAWACHTYNV
jgi:putative DNA primase/helicase